MGPSDALFLAGIAAIIVGLVGQRFSPGIAGKKRWFVIAGIVLVVLGGIAGAPDFARGSRDGMAERGK
jgi:hypothetical protein